MCYGGVRLVPRWAPANVLGLIKQNMLQGIKGLAHSGVGKCSACMCQRYASASAGLITRHSPASRFALVRRIERLGHQPRQGRGRQGVAEGLVSAPRRKALVQVLHVPAHPPTAAGRSPASAPCARSRAKPPSQECAASHTRRSG